MRGIAWGVVVIVLVDNKTLGFCALHRASEPLDLLLHFGMLTTLPDTLKVGFDLAFEV